MEQEKKSPRENFIFTDEYNLLYHFYVEGRTIKEVATVPPDVNTYSSFFPLCFSSSCSFSIHRQQRLI